MVYTVADMQTNSVPAEWSADARAAFKSYKPRHHKVYGAVCMSQDNRVLVVRGRRSGKWSFPKGHMEGNENAMQTALRELWEETGVWLGDAPRSSGYQKMAAAAYYFFDCDDEYTPAPHDTEEVEEARWMALQEFKRKDCNVDVNFFLDKMRAHLRRQAAVERRQELGLPVDTN